MTGQDQRPSYQECLGAGMTTTEAALARCVTVSAVSGWARRNGKKFRRDYTAHAERARKRMRALHKDPEFAAANSERMRALHKDPEFNHLTALSEDERADYDALKKAGYSRDEAFTAIGRVDLCKGRAHG